MFKERIFKIGFTLLVIILAFLLLRPIISTRDHRTKMVFFGLGKSDSIYIENGNNNMLIDAGLKQDKEKLLLKLDALRVKKLDYIILTHPDKDHIGSASYILDHLEIGQLIQSKHFKETKREARIAKVVEEKKIKNIVVKEDIKFDLGDLRVTIFAPKKDEYEKDNDYSLVTLIEDGNLNHLFAGDAEKELLDEIIEKGLPKIDLYKVAHHGKKNANSKKLIDKIQPAYSVITNYEEYCEIDDLLRDVESDIIYVFEKDLSVLSDGEKLKFK